MRTLVKVANAFDVEASLVDLLTVATNAPAMARFFDDIRDQTRSYITIK